MKLYTYLFLMFCFITSGISQNENLKNATIELNNNKTINGDIRFVDSEEDTFYVIDKNKNSTKFPIKDLKSITSETHKFKTWLFEGKVVLFEIVVEGKQLSLLKTSSNTKNSTYYILKSNDIHILKGEKKIVTIDNKTFSKYDTHYKGVLKVLLKSDEKLSSKIDKISYTEKDLAEIVIAANKGNISYLNTKSIKNKNISSNWLVYIQYSNVASHWHFSNMSKTSPFFQLGSQFYINESSRHSLKFGIEYGSINSEYAPSIFTGKPKITTNESFVAINTNYLIDFYRYERSDFYINFRLFDLMYMVKEDNSVTFENEKNIALMPRLSPGLGYQYYINNKINIYFEINHIFRTSKIPQNFSFGMSYDL